MVRVLAGLILGLGALGLAGCSSDSTATSSGEGGASAGSGNGSSQTSGPGPASGSTTSGMTSSGTGGTVANLCRDPVPAGAAQAADPPAYSGGACPTLVQGHNPGFMSSGVARDFIVVSPSNAMPGEALPVIFFWHWLGGSADDFLGTGDLANAVEQQRFIAAIPESIPALVFGQDLKWPYDVQQTQQRMDQEFRFFDDMLSCISQQFTVNKNCVSTAGVSAGALWSGQLGPARSQYLASFVSLSGGVGGSLIKPWSGAGAHKLPGLVLWGGPTDNCFGLLNFEETSNNLEAALTADGHFFIECIHNCGHGPPPVDVAPGASAFSPFWDFVFAHPFWLAAGDSPWKSGLPAGFIPWCGIGQGSAVPRSDPTCGSPGC